jgi:hypothetical protein
MPNYEHKKIIELITQLDAPPSDVQTFAEWIKANVHLAFLRENAEADEVVVYASGEYTFVHSLIVPNERLSPPDEDDLLSWNCNAYTSIASYVSGGGEESVWWERGVTSTGTKTLQGARRTSSSSFALCIFPDRELYWAADVQGEAAN